MSQKITFEINLSKKIGEQSFNYGPIDQEIDDGAHKNQESDKEQYYLKNASLFAKPDMCPAVKRGKDESGEAK